MLINTTSRPRRRKITRAHRPKWKAKSSIRAAVHVYGFKWTSRARVALETTRRRVLYFLSNRNGFDGCIGVVVWCHHIEQWVCVCVSYRGTPGNQKSSFHQLRFRVFATGFRDFSKIPRVQWKRKNKRILMIEFNYFFSDRKRWNIKCSLYDLSSDGNFVNTQGNKKTNWNYLEKLVINYFLVFLHTLTLEIPIIVTEIYSVTIQYNILCLYSTNTTLGVGISKDSERQCRGTRSVR